jgi:hypothetical protein
MARTHRLQTEVKHVKKRIFMEDNGDELEGGGLPDDEEVESEADPEDDAILHEKNGTSSPRENI